MSMLAACDPTSGSGTTNAEPELKPEELAAFGEGAVVFHVRDAGKGEVAIMQGADEVVVQDKQLVARVMRAANAVQAW